MTKVIKKSGKIQAFNTAKIQHSVLLAAKDAKIAPKEIKKLIRTITSSVIKLLRKKKTVKSSYIRKLLLKRLDKKAKSVATAWRKYDKRKK